MTDISQYLPETSKTVAAIYAAYKKAGDAEPVRGYLGASIIGHPCERYLWYCFRQCCKPEFDGRMYRLFETGDLEEARFVKDLRDIGCEVHDMAETPETLMDVPNSKKVQFEVSALGGHFSGHMDGCALGIPEAPKTWHVPEFKTCNAKSFKDLVKKGVKESKPQHYAQMMVYMHLTGMKRALYLARNKDNDELYSERIRYDKTEAEALMERARRIITAVAPPDRISGRPDFYQCNWCDAKVICWGSSSPDPALYIPSLSCRQCCHATPITRESLDGKPWWHCEKQEAPTDGEICKDHLILPGLLTFAEPTNYGTDAGNETLIDSAGQVALHFIEFTNNDGSGTWRHGKGGFSSKELTKLPVSALISPTLQKAKDLFGATATDHQEDILKRYPEEDSRIVWKGPASGSVKAWKEEYGEDLTKMRPIARFCNLPEYDSAELEGGRVVIVWEDGTTEIREGLE